MRVPGGERSTDLRERPAPTKPYAPVLGYDGIAARIAALAPLAGGVLLAVTLVLTRG